jgi:hypothetical protein
MFIQGDMPRTKNKKRGLIGKTVGDFYAPMFNTNQRKPMINATTPQQTEKPT